MAVWNVKLNFERHPNFDPPTGEEWAKLFPLVGTIVTWSGDSPPVEFSSTVDVEAEDQEDAWDRGVDKVWKSLQSEEIDGWMISSDTAQRKA